MAQSEKSDRPNGMPTDEESAALRASYPELQRQILDRMNEILPLEISARENANEQGDQIQSGPGDEADISVLDTSADYFLKLANNHQHELMELRDALERMRRGVYGICESCESPIAVERLRRLPAARLCIECQAAVERAAMALVQGGKRSTL